MPPAALQKQSISPERLEEALYASLLDSGCTLADVARRLCISPRSLQRLLGERGLTFREEAARARREVAVRHLELGDLSVDEISRLVGYKNTVSFMRAFHQWTGMSAGEYRKQLAAAASER